MKIDKVPPHSPLLNIRSEEVAADMVKSSEVTAIIARMFEIAYGKRGDENRRTMVGLAAPQVGVLKRIILVGINDTSTTHVQPELRAFINPKIIDMSQETEVGREGCFSTGKVCGIVERVSSLTLRALDTEGKPVESTYEGFVARIIQHEVDHLDGIRFPDRIKDEHKLHWVEEDEFGEYRLNWRSWKTTTTFKVWESIKNGSFN